MRLGYTNVNFTRGLLNLDKLATWCGNMDIIKRQKLLKMPSQQYEKIIHREETK